MTGLLDSSNRVNLLEGPAGAGKSYLAGQNSMKACGRPGSPLPIWRPRPTRPGCWQKDGFEVNTVARFLLDDQDASGGGWWPRRRR